MVDDDYVSAETSPAPSHRIITEFSLCSSSKTHGFSANGNPDPGAKDKNNCFHVAQGLQDQQPKPWY
jgi:hypothetical protein